MSYRLEEKRRGAEAELGQLGGPFGEPRHTAGVQEILVRGGSVLAVAEGEAGELLGGRRAEQHAHRRLTRLGVDGTGDYDVELAKRHARAGPSHGLDEARELRLRPHEDQRLDVARHVPADEAHGSAIGADLRVEDTAAEPLAEPRAQSGQRHLSFTALQHAPAKRRREVAPAVRDHELEPRAGDASGFARFFDVGVLEDGADSVHHLGRREGLDAVDRLPLAEAVVDLLRREFGVALPEDQVVRHG